MALRYVSITKEVPFQGRSEEFSNVYLYETSASDEAGFQAIVDAIVAAEKLVHAPDVVWTKARVYTTFGLNGVTDTGGTFHVATLSGAGSGTTVTSEAMYKECAVLVRWPLPRKGSILAGFGRHRSLKKFLHTCGAPSLNTAQQDGSGIISGVPVTALVAYANSVENPTAGAQMVAPDGSVPNAEPNVAPYVEHRQFPRGRKET
jgi:hypothetical protein